MERLSIAVQRGNAVCHRHCTVHQFPAQLSCPIIVVHSSECCCFCFIYACFIFYQCFGFLWVLTLLTNYIFIRGALGNQ